MSEPSNYHFEVRLIRRSAGCTWPDNLKPTLWDGIFDQAVKSDSTPSVALWNNVAIVSLGAPKLNATQLESKLTYFKNKLANSPDSALGWYQLARVAQQIKRLDEYHKAVEAGFKSMVGDIGSAMQDVESMVGLTGMFCEELVRSKFKSDQTTESLWQILQSTNCDGRLSVPLGHLLLAHDRVEDAKAAQLGALKNFVGYRRYYLPMKQCLFYPALFLLEREVGASDQALLELLIKLRELLAENVKLFPPLLAFIKEKNPELFIRINRLLKSITG